MATNSNKFETVKKFYNTFVNGERMWNETRVKNAVVKGWISESEYEEITGDAYSE